jgi:membrane-associated protease RseP (regulator of RpoE activity)
MLLAKRRVSLLAIALSIVASMALLLMAALVSAREPTAVMATATHDDIQASTPPSQPLEAVPVKPSEDSQRKQPAEHRLPVCAGYIAKIVSQNSNPALSLASLSHNGNVATLVRPGSSIGNHQVLAISYDGDRMSPRVVLSGKQGLCQAMTFEKAEAVTAARSTPKKHRRPAHSDHTEVLVDHSAVDAILERAFDLTRGVQVMPYVENDSIVGFRLLGVRPGSLLSTLGLENGDAILRVNGHAMTTVEQALSFYSNIRSLERLDIDINRLGRPARVEIRVN